MNKRELQTLEDSLFDEWNLHKKQGGFDTHAPHITRLYEVLILIVQHLNKKPIKKKK
jgi:hypothetical protein